MYIRNSQCVENKLRPWHDCNASIVNLWFQCNVAADVIVYLSNVHYAGKCTPLNSNASETFLFVYTRVYGFTVRGVILFSLVYVIWLQWKIVYDFTQCVLSIWRLLGFHIIEQFQEVSVSSDLLVQSSSSEISLQHDPVHTTINLYLEADNWTLFFISETYLNKIIITFSLF